MILRLENIKINKGIPVLAAEDFMSIHGIEQETWPRVAEAFIPCKSKTSIGGAKACACLPAGRIAPGISLKHDVKSKARSGATCLKRTLVSVAKWEISETFVRVSQGRFTGIMV